jgi:broad specificity phosphatase PhoE
MNTVLSWQRRRRSRWATTLSVVVGILACRCRHALSFSAESVPPNKQQTTYKFYILRHGQTDANAGGVIQGSGDFSRLTELGKAQAAQSLQAFDLDDRIIITSLYCSPLRRAQETLFELRRREAEQNIQRQQRLLLLPPITETTILDNLREIDFYDWQGRDKIELQKKFPDSWKAWNDGDPGGLMVLDTITVDDDDHDDGLLVTQERYPLLELWARADQVWDEIFELEQSASLKVNADSPSTTKASLIVAHGSLGQALLGTAMGWDATRFREYEFPNCGIAEIEWNVNNGSATTFTNKESRRPLATRWRWKWPVPSKEWSSLLDGATGR